MTTRFFTNERGNALLDKFAAVFANNPQIAEFDALVGYFHATGYFHLRPHLEQIKPIRVLVGINVDKWASEAQQQGLALRFGASREQASADYTECFKREVDQADYDEKIEDSIRQFVRDIESGKIQIKAHPSRRLHAKIYIFRPRNFNLHSGGEVITGSSNLTNAGLGTDAESANYEFNVSLRDYDDIRFATDEFEKLWCEAVDILPEAMIQAKDQTYLRDDCTPFGLYIKLLIEYFDKEIEFDPNSITDLPSGFKRLNYQMDAVHQGFEILNKHNGFFLADVVGLGKTIVAIMTARKYFFHNGFPEYRSCTLIVCPPALKAIWRETAEKFQLDNVEYITTGSLHKLNNHQKYDLIIVDEAHKFRNDASESYASLQSICKAPCRDGQKKRVILVSATPLNNRPNDIRNQLLLFQDANYSTLDVNISRFFNQATRAYKELIKTPAPDDADERLRRLYDQVRRKIIEPLTVRRTRADLMEHTGYADDLQKQGIVFPVVNPPENLLYQLVPEINTAYQQSFDRVQNKDNQGLRYTRYRLIEHLQPEHRKDYPQAEFFSERLTSIMKTLLIKRLDSSFYAFHQSLQRFVRASQQMLNMVNKNSIYIAPNQQIEKYLAEDREEELLKKLTQEQLTDPSIRILTRDAFKPELFNLLKRDHELLVDMELQWQSIVKKQLDPKLQLLLAELPTKLLNAQHNPERRLVIFSEATDTTAYLSEKLKEKDYRVLSIDATNRDRQQGTIRANFDANLPMDQQKSDYNILIATESLAEGVNLHRANTIVNYDTPWNATRLMQRIGRVNRIGSRASTIHIYNFFPTEQVEDDIGLKQRAQIKLQAFHLALGEDSQIYSPDEDFQSFGLFDPTVKEAEKVSGRLCYLMEIRTFKQESPDAFRRIKNLPLKLRNAVSDNERRGVTLCFLRNEKHNAFYQVNSHSEVEELGFLEVAPVFKCHATEKKIALPQSHHRQVQSAFDYFKAQAQDKIISEQQTVELTHQQKVAMQYLKAFISHENISADEKSRIQQAVEWVKLGRYQNLTRDVSKLQRNQKRTPVVPAKQLEALLKLIDKHAPGIVEITPAELQPAPSATASPEIIISQSYV